MLDKDVIHVPGKAEFDKYAKCYFVNMTNNMRTLHVTGKCCKSKCCNDFITFDSMEEIEKYQKIHADATPFRKCGLCFKKR